MVLEPRNPRFLRHSRFSVWWKPTSWFRDGVFSLWWKGGESSGFSFIRALTPFTRALPLWPHHLSSTPPPNTITLRVNLSTYELWGHTNIQTTATFVCHIHYFKIYPHPTSIQPQCWCIFCSTSSPRSILFPSLPYSVSLGTMVTSPKLSCL